MFSRRKILDGARKYSREFFEKFVADLRQAGFTKLEVKLPHNVVGIEGAVIQPEDLLMRERNYAALILVAENSEREEVLKVLFVNRSSRAVFIDDTFPSGESVPPALYFRSRDPGRAFAVSEFFYEYLKSPSLLGHWLLLIGALGSGLAEVVNDCETPTRCIYCSALALAGAAGAG